MNKLFIILTSLLTTLSLVNTTQCYHGGRTGAVLGGLAAGAVLTGAAVGAHHRHDGYYRDGYDPYYDEDEYYGPVRYDRYNAAEEREELREENADLRQEVRRGRESRRRDSRQPVKYIKTRKETPKKATSDTK